MADHVPNAENFEIDVILGNLDIDENIEIQNELFENDTDTSEITGLDEEVLVKIHDERILTELPTTPEILFIDEDDISKVHIDKKDKASTKNNLKTATGSGNSFVCIYCEKQYSRQKPYQMHVSVCCKERKFQVKERRHFYCLFVIVVDTYGFTLG